jgi:hypothetical protein
MATRSSARFGSTTELGIGLSARSPRGLNNSERRYALHLRPIGDRFVDLTAYFDEAVTRGPATIIILRTLRRITESQSGGRASD